MDNLVQEMRERLEVLFQRCPQLHGFAVPPDEQAEAAQLLRGRTFARTVH